ncbi:MAG TPA: folate-binding protein [Burkholderiales bacterium]|nr:folate-binding protein [Burkholderiales bacterium]
MKSAELSQYGLLQASGSDARAFLHAQLTNDIEALAAEQARYAGWCSAKGRLLASFLVVPHADGYLLQLSRDLAPAVAKRLSMFILRSKVKIGDASDAWSQFGLWGDGAEAVLAELGLASPAQHLAVVRHENLLAVRVAAQRYLLVAPATERARLAALPGASLESLWTLEEIRSGRPLITQATQDQFVPQMVNYERFGAVDFQKGCYPGQEIVARAQYRGQVKRRMVRVRTPLPLRPGQHLYSDDLPGQASGTVVNAAGDEALAVVQISTLEQGVALRAESHGAPLEVLPLPYAA